MHYKGKMNKIFHAEIKSETGEVIDIRVEKVLYIGKIKKNKTGGQRRIRTSEGGASRFTV